MTAPRGRVWPLPRRPGRPRRGRLGRSRRGGGDDRKGRAYWHVWKQKAGGSAADARRGRAAHRLGAVDPVPVHERGQVPQAAPSRAAGRSMVGAGSRGVDRLAAPVRGRRRSEMTSERRRSSLAGEARRRRSQTPPTVSISSRRLPNRSERASLRSTSEPTAWASAISATACGARVRSAAQLRKALPKPCTTVRSARPVSRSTLVSAMSLSGLAGLTGDGNTQPAGSLASGRIRSRAANAAPESGQCRARERDAVLDVGLHSLARDAPLAALPINFVPSCAARLAGAAGGQHDQPQARLRRERRPRRLDEVERRGRVPVRQRAQVAARGRHRAQRAVDAGGRHVAVDVAVRLAPGEDGADAAAQLAGRLGLRRPVIDASARPSRRRRARIAPTGPSARGACRTGRTWHSSARRCSPRRGPAPSPRPRAARWSARSPTF